MHEKNRRTKESKRELTNEEMSEKTWNILHENKSDKKIKK